MKKIGQNIISPFAVEKVPLASKVMYVWQLRGCVVKSWCPASMQ